MGKAWQAISRGKIKRSVAAESIGNVKSAIPNKAKRDASTFRFVDELSAEELATLCSRLRSDEL